MRGLCRTSARRNAVLHERIAGNRLDHKSGENCSLDEFGSGDEFGSVDLLASVGLNTRDLEAAVGANHRKSVGLDGNDLAKLPADALGVLGRQRFGVEDLESRAAQRSPGTGRGVAAADKAIDLLPRLAPIDLRVAGAAATLDRKSTRLNSSHV